MPRISEDIPITLLCGDFHRLRTIAEEDNIDIGTCVSRLIEKSIDLIDTFKFASDVLEYRCFDEYAEDIRGFVAMLDKTEVNHGT